MASKWDPCESDDWDKQNVSRKVIDRITRLDIPGVSDDKRPSGMYVLADEDDLTKFHVLIAGEINTPYEGGFFYFFVRLPPNYPQSPPKVKLMNTDGGKVRFNPNIYANGMVCISMIGTWHGQPWKSEYRIRDVLEAIQKQLNSEPYHNEPTFLPGVPFPEFKKGDAARYSDIIRHETLRVAVCDMMEGKVQMPDALRKVMKESFPSFWEYYEECCQRENLLELHGEKLEDPFVQLGSIHIRTGTFDFRSIRERLMTIKAALDEETLANEILQKQNGQEPNSETTAEPDVLYSRTTSQPDEEHVLQEKDEAQLVSRIEKGVGELELTGLKVTSIEEK